MMSHVEGSIGRHFFFIRGYPRRSGTKDTIYSILFSKILPKLREK